MKHVYRLSLRHDPGPWYRRLDLTVGLTFSRMGVYTILTLRCGGWRLSLIGRGKQPGLDFNAPDMPANIALDLEADTP